MLNYNWLVKDTDQLAPILHEAFHVAKSGRPGPVLVDIPKMFNLLLVFTFQIKKHQPPNTDQIKGRYEQITNSLKQLSNQNQSSHRWRSD